MNEILAKAKKLGIEVPRITAKKIDDQVKPVLRRMEKVGVKIDVKALHDLDAKLGKRVEKLEQEIHELAGRDFNIASPSQMAEILFTDLKLPIKDLKRTKSGVSTAARELEKIKDKHEIVKPILEHRELSKLISTYLKPLPLLVDENSRLHTTFGLETSTGRLNSSEPNLQNIPIRGTYGGDMRRAFIAEKGMKFISADYSQIELRVVAALAQDKAMLEAFKDGVDIHARTASEIFKVGLENVTPAQRRIAKAVNFGIIYGQTPYGLSQTVGISGKEAAEYITQYFDIHRGIKSYINETIRRAHEEGYVETLFGLKKELPNIDSHNRYVAESEERMAINMPVQGTAAEILKLAMIKLDEELASLCHFDSSQRAEKSIQDPSAPVGMTKNGCPRIILTIHDELLVEVPSETAQETAKLVKETMENVIKLPIPITAEVGIGDNWAEAK